jgi:hypothetical protein
MANQMWIYKGVDQISSTESRSKALKEGYLQLSPSSSARGRCGDIEPLGNRGAGDDRMAI